MILLSKSQQCLKTVFHVISHSCDFKTKQVCLLTDWVNNNDKINIKLYQPFVIDFSFMPLSSFTALIHPSSCTRPCTLSPFNGFRFIASRDLHSHAALVLGTWKKIKTIVNIHGKNK